MPKHGHVDRAQKKRELGTQKRNLPIFSGKETLMAELDANQAIVLVGETGSEVPQYVFEWMYNRHVVQKGKSVKSMPRVAITQPRRVAAISVAQRVREEMMYVHNSPKDTVGYRVRFEDSTTFNTKIKFVTDGMLLREALLDTELSSYGVIIVDEAHERTINTDVLFGLLFQLKSSRPDLRIIVMSATLDAEHFSDYFSAKVLYVEGRQYPVQTYYASEPQPDYIDAALVTILQIHLYEAEGDILVFLTGREEIEAVEKLLLRKQRLMPEEAAELLICPLYAALPPAKQMRVFEPTPKGSRKVVIATNIAETSITINGIRYVVDCGLVKARMYSARTGLDALVVQPVSKASARQRLGRAGRERPGVCYRLFPESSFGPLKDTTVPEIMRCNLAAVLLQMKAMGIEDVLDFPFLDRPPTAALRRALEELYALGALTPNGNISPLGKLMAELPLVPMYSKAILQAEDYACMQDMLSIVSMLSVESIFFCPHDKREEATAAKRRFAALEGDCSTALNVYNAFVEAKGNKKTWCHENFLNIRALQKVQEVRKQLEEYTDRMDLSQIVIAGSASEDVKKMRQRMDVGERVSRCLASALFLNTALLHPNGAYRTVKDSKETFLHPSSVLFGKKKPQALVFCELVLTSKQYMRDVQIIDAEWLIEAAPHYFSNTAE